jgi:ubiquinone/menaquinone biosynthesis C-methylase UbiE
MGYAVNLDEIRRIDGETCDRYNRRLEEHGPSARAVGWDSEASQWTRFSVAIRGADFNGKTVMDIGCGLADFYRFLKSRGITVGQYIGADVNPRLLAIAQEKFPEAHFEKRNILLAPFSHQVCDVAVMNGVLNFRFQAVDNYEYAKEMIERAFAACRELLIVDMLSSYLTPDYPPEDFVFYYSPEEMFRFAQTLTSYVSLSHDYPPIPQNEFTLFLRRNPCP